MAQSTLSDRIRAQLRTRTECSKCHRPEKTPGQLAIEIGGGSKAISAATIQRFLASKPISSEHLDLIADWIDREESASKSS